MEQGFDDFQTPWEEEGKDPADPVVRAELAGLSARLPLSLSALGVLVP